MKAFALGCLLLLLGAMTRAQGQAVAWPLFHPSEDAPGGRIFSLFDQPPPPPAGVRAEFLAGGSGPGTLREKLDNLVAMVARGELAPHISAVYTPAQAAQAQESGRTGKVLVRPG